MEEGWVSEEDHERRIDARRARRGMRAQRCRHCQGKMPLGKRADAVYCSRRCASRYNARKQYQLPQEIRKVVRQGVVLPTCPECGQPLNTRFRPGPVPKLCLRCYNRRKQQESRSKKQP